MLKTNPGRAPIYSALSHDFVECLVAMADDTCEAIPFNKVEEFHRIMDTLIKTTVPYLPKIGG